jgi:uncharacterized membrane protein YsdA (DUF1294 family)
MPCKVSVSVQYSLFRFACMFYVLFLIIIINSITFITFGLDKRKAVRHQRRIPERVLLTLTFLGGTIGAIAGMLFFRHKISKKAFLMKLVVVVLIQGVLAYTFSRVR